MRTFVVVITVLALAACNRKDRYKIIGPISNAEKMMLHLDEVDVYENNPSDSIVLKKNGRFSFTFETRISRVFIS